MRIALMVLLVLVGAPAFAAWESMISISGMAIYIDPQTIEDDGGKRRVLALVAYDEALANGAQSQSGIMEYDCTEKRLRTISFSQYAEPLAQGGVLSDNRIPSEWSAIAPGTFAEHALGYVCTK